MMRLCALGCLSIVILGLVSCGGVIPARVQYAEYPKEAISKADGDVGGYQFRHRRSVIMLEYDKDMAQFQARIAPYELKPDGSYSTLYRVWGIDNYRQTTQLKISYVDNTKFIDQLQVTTKDNLADTISKIGALGKAAVPLIAAATVSAPKEAPPIKFRKTMIDPAKVTIGEWMEDPLNKGYCLRLRDIVSESSLSLQQYVANGIGQWQNTFPVPACNKGVVDIAEAPLCKQVADSNIKISLSVTYADANMVLPMSLPSSGSLKMNSVCGASVTEADKQDRADLLNDLNILATQVQDVSDAWKKAKAGKSTTGK